MAGEQPEFHADGYDVKYRLISAGTGGGKTIAGAMEAMIWSLGKNFDYNRDLLYQLCRSQDFEATVSNKLAHGVVEYETHCSLLLTSFIIENLQTLTVEGGFFPRFLSKIIEYSLQEIENLRDKTVDNLGVKSNPEANFEELISRLQEIKKKIDPPTWENLDRKEQWEFNFDKVRGLLKEKAHELDKELESLEPQYVEKLKQFTNRRDLQMVKLACHHAILELRKDIEPRDVEYVFKIMMDFWSAFLQFIVEKLRLPDQTLNFKELRAVNMLKIDEPIRANEFRDMLMKEFGFTSPQSAYAMMNALGKRGHIKRFGENEKRMVVRLK